MKAILATGELGTLRNVARASMVCMMAGADFIKTSTGKEAVNATLPVTWSWCAPSATTTSATGFRVGYKPAGGISKAKDALSYLALMKDELGDAGCSPTSSASAPPRFSATSSGSSSTTSPAPTRPPTATPMA